MNKKGMEAHVSFFIRSLYLTNLFFYFFLDTLLTMAPGHVKQCVIKSTMAGHHHHTTTATHHHTTDTDASMTAMSPKRAQMMRLMSFGP